MSNLNVNNLTSLAGNNGTIGVSSSLNVSGSITLTGNVTANGNIVLGDSTGDSVSLGAEISSSIIPDANATYNLGSSVKQWKEVHARSGSFSLGVDIEGGLNVDGDSSTINNLDITPVPGKGSRLTSRVNASRATIFISSASFDSVISSSLIPAVDDASDLGSSLRQWKDLYVDGTAYLDYISGPFLSTGPDSTLITGSLVVNGNTIPNSNEERDLGLYNKRWRMLHAKSASFDEIGSVSASIANLEIVRTQENNKAPLLRGAWRISSAYPYVGRYGVHISTASFTDVVSSSLVPAVDDAFDLGSSVRQWKDLYIDGVAFIDSASIQGLISSLIPDADNARDLGSNTKQWRNLYIDGKAFIDEISGSSLSGADSALTASVDIVPGGMLIESIHDLGSSTRRWNDLYIKNVEFGNNISLTRDGNKGVSLEGALSVTKAITASNARFASMSTTNHPQNLNAFSSGDLYFMSGSQIFTGSAFVPGHADQIFTSPSFSSSIFVFKK